MLTNCLVNRVTHLTLVLGLPALFPGLRLRAAEKLSGRRTGQPKSKPGSGASGDTDTGISSTGCPLFRFWQCSQVFDVLKHNVRQRQSFGAWFYFDVGIVIVGAFGLYTSIAWLVTWLAAQDGGFVNASNLGWLSGWLMVLPNALLAFYYAARRRADIAYASQFGDGQICIPLGSGLAAMISPLPVPTFFETRLAILIGATVVYACTQRTPPDRRRCPSASMPIECECGRPRVLSARARGILIPRHEHLAHGAQVPRHLSLPDVTNPATSRAERDQDEAPPEM